MASQARGIELEKALSGLTQGLIRGTQPNTQFRVWIVGLLKHHCPFLRGEFFLTKSQWNYGSLVENFRFKKRRRRKKLDGLVAFFLSFFLSLSPSLFFFFLFVSPSLHHTGKEDLIMDYLNERMPDNSVTNL